MIAKIKMPNRVISLMMTVMLLLSMIPFAALTANAAEAGTVAKVSDPFTVEQWMQYFPTSGNLTTENAGGVWTDKSVFTSGTTIDGEQFSLNGENNFLAALSAIGSNMTVTGMSQVPTDVMFVLDVSGSMGDGSGNNDVAEDLVNAANASMRSLLSANPYTRVGLVLYSGPSTTLSGNQTASQNASASVILPLASYRTDNAQGNYLDYSISGWSSTTETVKVNDGVYKVIIQNGQETRQSVTVTSKQVVGGTYIQAGLDLAKDEFLAATTTLSSEGKGTVNRKPVIVLMSDGAPTLATTAFDNVGNSNLGTGAATSTTYAMGFVTQLTAAHTKYLVSEKYGSECLFYTLGMLNANNNLSNTAKNVANGVFNPAASCNDLVNLWNGYKNTQAGSSYSLSGYSNRSVTRVTDQVMAKMSMNYVTRYFDANAYTGNGGSLGAALAGAFNAIVEEIALQSVYYPSLVEDGKADLSGYISFVDKLGQYMKVTDIKGIMSGQHLYAGNVIAKRIYDELCQDNGSLGSQPAAGATGAAFVNSIATRLSISDAEAWSLIKNAWDAGQFTYTSDSVYSNWFGWISNAQGSYLGSWKEGDTLLPNTAYINRSYIYLGADGDTNMMYATVRIREKVSGGVPTGEQEVDFAIPASLLPTITYNVALDEDGEPTDITVKTDTPIHLIYEAGLDPEINKFNVRDKVSPAYYAANCDNDGNILFYTNAWEQNTGDGTVNTYSYFKPSHQNDRYYYQNDSLVYTKNGNQYTVYTGANHPVNTAGDSYYYRYYFYAKTNSGYQKIEQYKFVPKDVLSVATANADSTWTINAGTVRSDYASTDADEITKAGNPTGTLSFSHKPFSRVTAYAYDEADHSSVVGVVMANNGRLALTPETGIRLSKSLAADVQLQEGENPTFTFELSYAEVSGDLEAYAYRFADGQLTGKGEKVTFEKGKASVSLKAGEMLYIGDMENGKVTVKETTALAYVVQTVSVNGAVQSGNEAEVTLTTGDMMDVDFVNARRGTGVLNVAKSVRFGEGVSESAIAEHAFDVDVTLVWNGEPLANYHQVTDAAGKAYPTDENGTFTVALSHGKQVTLYNIPEGTEATVVERQVTYAGYNEDPVYWENGTEKQNGTNAVVDIEADKTADVMIRNTYAPTAAAEADFEISLVKDFFMMSGDQQTAVQENQEYTFTFTLQRETANGWQDVDTAAITYGANGTDIRKASDEFAESLKNETYSEPGIYRYRIRESLGNEQHVIYDERTHSFGVQVADTDADGAWEIVWARTSTPDVVTIQDNAGVYAVEATFENEYDVQVGTVAVLEIHKTVKDPAGVVYKPNPNPGEEDIRLAEGFTFRVYEQDGITPVNGVNAQVTNSGGVARFTLTFDAETQPGSYHYVIKEIGDAGTGWTYAGPQYVTVVISTDDGTLKAAAYTDNSDFTLQPGSGDTDNLAQVSFENVYNPSAAELALSFVNKKLAGREFDGDSFSFKLVGTNKSSIYDAQGNTVESISGTATANSGNTANVNFAGSLYFHEVGTYYYAISEISPDGNGITADKSVYRVTVNVTDNGTGALRADYIVTSVAGNEITFVNTYRATPVSLSITGTKTLTGRTLTENDFVFVLKDAAGAVVDYAVNSEFGGNTSGFAFDAVTYTEAGTYTYTVNEYVPQNTFGVTYDSTAYTVTVTVADDGEGNLVAGYTVNGNADTEITFANTYTPTPIAVQISGIKEILGRGMVETDSFTFALYEASREADGTWKQGKELETVHNTDSSIVFGDLPFTQAGVYRYMVSETAGSQGGITYDGTVWRIAVVVTDDGNGSLDYTIHYLNDSGPQNMMVFLNRYSVEGGSVEIKGKKTLTGKALTAGQFTFDLYETDESFAVLEGSEKKAYAVNDADGLFSFTLDYAPEDNGKTFYYVLTEQNAGSVINGISYSTDVYGITVTVADDANGKLVITPSIMLNGEETDAIAFVNKYTATATATVQIDKVVENKGSQSITPEGFAFLLELVGGENPVKVITDANGKAVINLDYSEADIGKTFTYKLSEIKTDEPYVTYDEKVYTFTVTVGVDTGDELTATVKLDGETVEVLKAQFVNVYDYTPKIPNSPQTGDNSNMTPWIVLLVIGAMGLGATVVLGRRKRQAK